MLDILLMEVAVFFPAEVWVFQGVGVSDVNLSSWNKFMVFMHCVWPRSEEHS